MASLEDIALLRANVNEPSNEEPFTDEQLSTYIDALGVSGASAAIWRRKAAGVVDLVNVSENGSSRSMGSLYQQYLGMAKEFSAETPSDEAAATSRTRRIERA